MTAALGPIKDIPSATSVKENIKGSPTKRIEIIPTSVQISISCLVLKAPTIEEPCDSWTPPAWFVAVGVQSTALSLSENLTNKGSIVEEPIALAPKAITCLSTSDVIICKQAVGTSLAPVSDDKATALVVNPSDLSQK